MFNATRARVSADRIAFLCVTVIFLWAVGGAAGIAQTPSPSEEPSPSPTEEITDVCQIGQLCGNIVEPVKRGEDGSVNDPPGKYVRSLITIAFIALIAGTYMFIALRSGRGF